MIGYDTLNTLILASSLTAVGLAGSLITLGLSVV